MSVSDPSLLVIMFFILPLWLIAGFCDWLCHRKSKIELTSGAKESAIHLLMFAEIGIPLILALFFDVNALLFLILIVAFFAHELTALWDVSIASNEREVTATEQHIHSFLEMIPLMLLLLLIVRHFPQFLALFGLGSENAHFTLTLKKESLPNTYIFSLLFSIVVFEILPYSEEFLRGLKRKKTGSRN